MPQKSVTAEQFVALNREFAALVRAGVPLEHRLGANVSSRSSSSTQIANRIVQQLEAGKSLSSALENEQGHLSDAYVAIVEAGLQAGRLPEILEAVAELTEEQTRLRKSLRLSLYYPLCIAGLTYLFLLFFLQVVFPRHLDAIRSLRIPESRLMLTLAWLRNSSAIWGPLLPILLALVPLLLNVMKRPTSGTASGFSGWQRLVPGTASIYHHLELSWFCRILAALVANHTPLPRAVELAAGAVGDRRLQASARRVASDLREGRPLEELLQRHDLGLPAMVKWVLAADSYHEDFAVTLRQSAGILQGMAQRRADWQLTLLPVATILILGGGTLLVYVLATVLPLVNLFENLSLEPFV